MKDDELFKEESYQAIKDYPKWISREVIDVLNKYLAQITNKNLIMGYTEEEKAALQEKTQALINCHTCTSLQNHAWGKAETFFPDNPAKGQAWLSGALMESFRHPKTSILTESKAEKWKKDLLKSLKSAHNLVNKTPDNYAQWQSDFGENLSHIIQSKSLIVKRDENGNKELCSLSGQLHIEMFDWGIMLEAMIDSLSGENNDSYFYKSHTRGKTADRNYFVRALTNSLLARTKKKHLELVEYITGVAFAEEVTPSGDMISRLTNDLSKDNAIEDINQMSITLMKSL